MAASSLTLYSIVDDHGGDSRTLFTEEHSFQQMSATPDPDSAVPRLKLLGDESGGLDEEMIPPPNGRLTKSIVSKYLSNLGRAGDGTTFAYRDLELIGLNLADIGVLRSFQFIRHLNISNNNLTTLVVLSEMRWLVTLIASHNRIETLLDFKAPQALSHVDFSYNSIRIMNNLSEHVYIETLILDHNDILEIGGLDNLRRLKELRLSHNRITTLAKSIGHLPIQKLDLSYNALTRIECMDGLELLCELDLSGNRIRLLGGLNGHPCLTRLDLSSNEIIDIGELEKLRSLQLLSRGEFSLNLANNPVCELPDFRLYVLHSYPNLAVLNNKRVRTEEKVTAMYTFSPPIEHVAAVNHANLAVYSFLQPAALDTFTLPDAEMCYPMLVIVGPDGSGREYLMMRLANEFSDVFSVGSLCTTRPLYGDEMDGREFAHIPMELFDSQVKAGQFLSIYNMGQHVFGFHKQSLEQAAADGTACVTHMELEGMLCLRLVTSLRPRYVLTVPLDAEAQDNRLRGRGLLSDQQIAEAMKRRELYIDYHQKHPGYFDAVISTDNLEDAYSKLKSLVLDYLGRATAGSRNAAAGLGSAAVSRLAAAAAGDSNKVASTSGGKGGTAVSAGGVDLLSESAQQQVMKMMMMSMMAGSLVQRSEAGVTSPSTNTLGTERSLYRVRYEALQRVMSGGRRSGLKELMANSSSPRRHRPSLSAGGRNVGSVAIPMATTGRINNNNMATNKSATFIKNGNAGGVGGGGNSMFGVTANGVELLQDDGDDSVNHYNVPKQNKIVNNGNFVGESSTSDDDMAMIAALGGGGLGGGLLLGSRDPTGTSLDLMLKNGGGDLSVRASSDRRLGSAKYHVLPPIINIATATDPSTTTTTTTTK